VLRVETAATWLFSVVILATEVSMSEEKAKPAWNLKNLNNVLRTACMKCTFSSPLTPLLNLWLYETKSRGTPLGLLWDNSVLERKATQI